MASSSSGRRLVMSVVLGAGASRDVSYAYQQDVQTPSPLDSDFFDILQRITPRDADRKAVAVCLSWVRSLPYECWRSFERAFYTLHLKALMGSRLAARHEGLPNDSEV